MLEAVKLPIVLFGCGLIIGPDAVGGNGRIVDYLIAFVAPLMWSPMAVAAAVVVTVAPERTSGRAVLIAKPPPLSIVTVLSDRRTLATPALTGCAAKAAASLVLSPTNSQRSGAAAA